jgi:hypothetical protein
MTHRNAEENSSVSIGSAITQILCHREKGALSFDDGKLIYHLENSSRRQLL